MSDTFVRNLEEEITTVPTGDMHKFLIKDIPKECVVEIADRLENGIYQSFLEGEFGWEDNHFCAFIRHDWYRKYWDFPLGVPFHMDLMKRLAEFKSNKDKDIIDINFSDDGDWCHLTYTILIPDQCSVLKEAFDYSKNVLNWIDNIVQSAQEETSNLITKITSQYNEVSLLEFPELIKKVKETKDVNEKGKYLEELIAKLFGQIKGFEIIERVRTKTEEIDIVIINKSQEPFWEHESKLVLIECKNWKKRPAGKNEYISFRTKLENRRGRAKIGFFISGKGFAKTFGIEDIRNSDKDLLIIPIELKQIIEIIEKQKDFQKEIEGLYVKATTK